MIELLVNKKDVLEPLAQLQSIVDRKSNITIIHNVLLVTKDDLLEISATDLEINIKANVKCKVKNHGQITVNAKTLFEIIKEFPSDNLIFFEMDNFWIKITGNNEEIEYKIAGLPADNFPTFPAPQNEVIIEIETEILKEMIDRTITMIAIEDQGKKIALNGILCENITIDGGSFLRMVSSNGYRLSMIDKQIIFKNNLDKQIIFSKKGANELKKLCDTSERLDIGVEDNFCYIKNDKYELNIRLIEDKFPDYRLIIPTNFSKIITINKTDLLNCLRRLVILTDDIYSSVAVTFENNKIILETINTKVGMAKETIKIDYTDENLKMIWNGRDLISILSLIKSNEINLKINTTKTPCVITERDNNDYLALFMPITLTGDNNE